MYLITSSGKPLPISRSICKILATFLAFPGLALSSFSTSAHAEVCSQGAVGYRIDLPAVFNSNSSYYHSDTGAYRTRLTRSGPNPIDSTLLCTPASYPPKTFRPFPMNCRTEDGVYTVGIAPDRSRPGQQLAIVSHGNSRTPVPCTR